MSTQSPHQEWTAAGPTKQCIRVEHAQQCNLIQSELIPKLVANPGIRASGSPDSMSAQHRPTTPEG